MPESFGVDNSFHHKSLVGIHIILPIDGFDGFVNLIRMNGIEAGYGFEDAQSGSQMKIGLVHKTFVPFKKNGAPSQLYLVASQLNNFFSQNFFQALQGFGQHFKMLFLH